MPLSSRELRSSISKDGLLRLWLEDVEVRSPDDDEIVVRVEAAPLNPSDMILVFGPVDPATLRLASIDGRSGIEAEVPSERLAAVAGRLDQPMPVGNEGAGTIVEAGARVRHLLGRRVALRASPGTYAQLQVAKAAHCILLPDDISSAEGAAAIVNPLTALGMVETMRREGHSAIVHTAAASNLGQMLNRLCQAEDIPLINVVRRPEHVDLLRGEGAQFVIDSSAEGFADELRSAIRATNATLAFDAIGGGRMAASILSAMEAVQVEKLTAYSRYGSPVHKQVYIYGMLDPSPRLLDGQFGLSWSVSGWLMTWFYERIGAEAAQRLRDRVAPDLKSVFASSYAASLSFEELLVPDTIRSLMQRATGEKVLLLPNAA